MAMTNVEHEALRRTILEEAARMIAEVVPPARDLATKADLRDGLAALSRRQQWMLGFFVPVWVATFGTLIAVVLKA